MIKSSNTVVQNALKSAHPRVTNSYLDYSVIKPEDKWDVLDDLEVVCSAGKPDIADMRKIKRYAQKFGVMDEFNKYCAFFGMKV